jgi:hypothetical protein
MQGLLILTSHLGDMVLMDSFMLSKHEYMNFVCGDVRYFPGMFDYALFCFNGGIPEIYVREAMVHTSIDYWEKFNRKY